MESNETKLETRSYRVLLEWDDEEGNPEGFPKKVTLSHKNKEGAIFGRKEYLPSQQDIREKE